MKKTKPLSKLTLSRPATYAITVQGLLTARCMEMFEGLSYTTDSDLGTTTLSGSVADQAALHGQLNLIRDLGLPLCSVQWIDPG